MFDFPVPPVDWLAISPIVIVVVTGMLALFVEMIRPKRNNNGVVGVCLLGLVAAAWAVGVNFGQPEGELLAGMAVRDRFGLVFELLILGATFMCLLFSEGYLREKRIPFGEFYPLVLWSAAGGMVMATTRNLLVVFLGIEVLSIALYVLAGMSRSEERSEESALKYFLLGAFASGFLLYGIAFVFGATGSLHLGSLAAAWTSGEAPTRAMLVFGLALILIGLGFKNAFVPFHQWTPDVYQGAPTNVTAFMAAVSKIAAIAALWRVLEGAQVLSVIWLPALSAVAILTMTVGNLVAIVQKDVKRILAYSSISHAGYVLVGVLAHFKSPGEIGATTVFYYLLSYSLMTIGAFAVVSLAARGGREVTGLASLNGLWKRSPVAAISLLVFVISLIGIPPTAGFIGKFLIFRDALQTGLTPLAIVLAVNSVVSVYYYVGIARAAFVAEEAEEGEGAAMNPALAGTCALCAVGVFAAAFLFEPLVSFMGLR